MYDLSYKVWPQTYLSMNRKCVNPNEVIRAAHLDTRDLSHCTLIYKLLMESSWFISTEIH